MVQSTQPQFPLIDDATIKNAFADVCVGINVTNGNFHMTFASLATDYSANQDPAPQSRVVSAKLVMPVAGAISLRDLLSQMVDRLVAQGVLVQGSPPTPSPN